eukprot:6177290-Pleurochrysis_carterae.AAC.2
MWDHRLRSTCVSEGKGDGRRLWRRRRRGGGGCGCGGLTGARSKIVLDFGNTRFGPPPDRVESSSGALSCCWRVQGIQQIPLALLTGEVRKYLSTRHAV